MVWIIVKTQYKQLYGMNLGLLIKLPFFPVMKKTSRQGAKLVFLYFVKKLVDRLVWV